MQEFSITQNDADQRLDKFLKKLFPNATRSLIYKINRKEKIKVITKEGKKTKQDNEYKLQFGEKVQIYLKDEDFTELQSEEKESQVLSQKQKFSKADIVFEDGNLLVVNKSAGINVHPGDHKSEEISLIEQVQDYLGEKLSSLTFKPSLIHRIDRDTSGIVMIAKDKESLTKLSLDFGEKENLKKVYLALVFGKLSRPEGTIKKNLKRIENAKNENKVQVSDS
jgi:23S rRNA pseudouridine955/2504/2580 synthase